MIAISKCNKIRKTVLSCFLVLLTASMITSCEDNELSELLEEEVIPDTNGGDGDIANLVTYQNTAKAILDNACVQCHNATQANGGIRLHDYTNASSVALSGRMITRMTSSGSPMPPSGNLPDAIVQDIMDWIDDGAFEN